MERARIAAARAEEAEKERDRYRDLLKESVIPRVERAQKGYGPIQDLTDCLDVARAALAGDEEGEDK